MAFHLLPGFSQNKLFLDHGHINYITLVQVLKALVYRTHMVISFAAQTRNHGIVIAQVITNLITSLLLRRHNLLVASFSHIIQVSARFGVHTRLVDVHGGRFINQNVVGLFIAVVVVVVHAALFDVGGGTFADRTLGDTVRLDHNLLFSYFIDSIRRKDLVISGRFHVGAFFTITLVRVEADVLVQVRMLVRVDLLRVDLLVSGLRTEMCVESRLEEFCLARQVVESPVVVRVIARRDVYVCRGLGESAGWIAGQLRQRFVQVGRNVEPSVEGCLVFERVYSIEYISAV